MNIVDKFGFKIEVGEDYLIKISEKMPPVSIEMLENILKNPECVMMSKNIQTKRCYYKTIDKNLFKAVVKFLKNENEHWLNTAHKTDGIRETEVFDENSI